MAYAVLIITTTKSSSWFNSNSGVSILCGITRPSQNDKNMPRVSGRATVATRPPFWNYFHPRLLTSRSQRLLNPVFRPITCSKKKGFFLFCFCILSVFYKPIKRTIIVHAGRRTDGLVRKKRPKRHWKTDTTTGTLHYLYLWVILDVTEFQSILSMKINKNLLSDIDWLSQSIKIDNHSPMRLNVIDFHWLCFSFGPHNFTYHVEHVCISLMCTLLQDFFWYFKPRIRQIY